MLANVTLKTRTEAEIRELLDVLVRLDVATVIMPVVERGMSHGRIRLTWPAGSAVYDAGAMNPMDYLAMVNSGSYSAILYDGSMLQISFDFLGSQLTGQRLAYLPCPFEVDTELRTELGIIGAIEFMMLDKSQPVVLRGPIRFDYDPDAAGPNHPQSHMTIGADSCRIPITRPITLGHFVRFIFRHFYPYLHQAYDVLAAWRIGTGQAVREVAAPDELHLNWRSSVGDVAASR